VGCQTEGMALLKCVTLATQNAQGGSPDVAGACRTLWRQQAVAFRAHCQSGRMFGGRCQAAVCLFVGWVVGTITARQAVLHTQVHKHWCFPTCTPCLQVPVGASVEESAPKEMAGSRVSTVALLRSHSLSRASDALACIGNRCTLLCCFGRPPTMKAQGDMKWASCLLACLLVCSLIQKRGSTRLEAWTLRVTMHVWCVMYVWVEFSNLAW
jgi:hypothetical protein